MGRRAKHSITGRKARGAGQSGAKQQRSRAELLDGVDYVLVSGAGSLATEFVVKSFGDDRPEKILVGASPSTRTDEFHISR